MASSITRRKALKYSVQSAAVTALGGLLPLQPHAAPATPNFLKSPSKNGKIVVVGAGAFGGWTALHLLRKGYQVTLIDQFGPGNNQASSGGETRVIRAFYGDKQIYFDLVLRALEIWKANEPLMGKKLLHQNGLAVFVPTAHDAAVEAALPMYQKAGVAFDKISPAEAAKRWPQVHTTDLDHVRYEPIAGYLEARKGCMAVCELFEKEGGKFLLQQVKSHTIKSGRCTAITLGDGSTIEADHFLFAGGPWLVRLFPEVTKALKVTRQVIFFFAPPPDADDLMENKLPVWFNKDAAGTVNLYGIPGHEHRGFKAASELTDVITDKFDTYNRYYKPEELDFVQRVMVNRFPKMAGRPLIEHRVCQYTETPDKDFVLDHHPQASNLWLMGGGSGHGYKMGASFGEMAAQTIAGEGGIEPKFALTRLLA